MNTVADMGLFMVLSNNTATDPYCWQSGTGDLPLPY